MLRIIAVSPSGGEALPFNPCETKHRVSSEWLHLTNQRCPRNTLRWNLFALTPQTP
jgi:hypothetical protein